MGKWRYGVVLDAGSSGTRLHIYRWHRSSVARAIATDVELHSLPVVSTKKKWTVKVKPGISTFGETPDAVGPDHLHDLFKHAKNEIPKDDIPETPLFLLATAGMRLLPDLQKQAILDEVCRYARETTKFLLPDCDLHIQVISGETEGLYGWVAANYLVGGFDRPQEHAHGDNHHTYGFLDMGGASAQIAFAPNSTESEKHANDLQLLRLRTVDGSPTEYRVFVTTWLGYGVNEARRRYVQALLDSVDLEQTSLLPDPCLPKGLEVKKDWTIIEPQSAEAAGMEPYLLGTGRFPECLAQTLPLLDKDALCDDPPCLFHGVHVPAIDFHVNHFIGISEYWHTTHEIFEMAHTDKAYDFLTYQARVAEFCSKEWDTITEAVDEETYGKKVDKERAAEVCFKASWIINMLHEGIGIPRVGIEASTDMQGENGTTALIDAAKQEGYLAPFQALNKVDDNELSWTLGKIVLYAASQVPPANDEVLAVGFGSNQLGIPTDFHYAGGKPDMTMVDDLDMSELLDDTDDYDDDVVELANVASPGASADFTRRIPGFIFFVLIILFIVYLLVGRERRLNLFRKISHPFRRNKKSGDGAFSTMQQRHRDSNYSSRLPFGLGSLSTTRKGKYEPVLDGNNDIEASQNHQTDVELGIVSSSSDDDLASLNSKSSASTNGRRMRRHGGTVTPRGGGSGTPPQYNSQGGYFANVALSTSSVAQNAGLGLVPRTDSRERLDRLTRSISYDSSLGNSYNGGTSSNVGLGTGLGFGTGPGRRSRAGSPNRWRSPVLTPLKENVD